MKEINVIITMAGKSSRFISKGYDGPKWSYITGKKTMIEHVLDMFIKLNPIFHLVISKSQEKYSHKIQFLENLPYKKKIHVIKDHNRGPTFSALQIKNIDKNSETIVCYCDFYLDWNCINFVKEARQYDAAISSFKGFHPASFGDTLYAYIKTDKSLNFLKLKEKASFTNKRENEHASTGVYYFNKWEIFEKFAKLLIKKDKLELPETYTSLLFNDLHKNNYKIKVIEAKKFICLGTPEDFEQYKFWFNYFVSKIEGDKTIYDGTLLVPMAGKGSRFRDIGYRVAKPLIQIGNKPMIQRALQSFPNFKKSIFLVMESDLKRHNLKNRLKNITKNSDILPIKKHTSGQATTCLLAKEHLADNEPLFITSCDYETIYKSKEFLNLTRNKKIDVIVWTFRAKNIPLKDPKAFAYCKVKKNSRKIEYILEKNTISKNPEKDPLVVGSFWYRKSKFFKDAALKLINDNITVNNEYYVATSINFLIKSGKNVVIFDIDKWISFGNPFELSIYEYWKELFELN